MISNVLLTPSRTVGRSNSLIYSLFIIKLTSLEQMEFGEECLSLVESPNFSKNNIYGLHNQRKILFKVLIKVSMALALWN